MASFDANNEKEEDQIAVVADAPVSLKDNPDPYYRICYGNVHIEDVAKYHCYSLCLIIILILADCTYMASLSYLFLFRQISIIIGVILILVALRKRLPRLYLPFLIINGLWTVVLFSLLFFAVFIIMIQYEVHGEHIMQLIKSQAVTVTLRFTQMLLCGWMQIVMYKAYKYMVAYQKYTRCQQNQHSNPCFSDDLLNI
ncbi:hypothetical protein Ddc_12808 [Ditylenchus destructor]|nr:hypothetical protein Ddc_12808 [Ditylenchus destructor]